MRTAVALSAMTGRAIALRNVRARRPKPGLAAQHLTAVRAAAALCRAEITGLELGAREFTFRPGRPQGGYYDFNVGTAGSVVLVLQAALPAAFACGEPIHLRLAGGTDVKAAPPLDYFRYVLLPLLSRMGLPVNVTVLRRGYYPRGGGVIEVSLSPVGQLHPLHLDTLGAVQEIEGIIHTANLADHVAERMRQAALRRLEGFANARIDCRRLSRSEAIGHGGAIVLWARTQHALLGAASTAERGVPAERIGEEAAQALDDEIRAGATMDIHASDQLLIYLALAQGASRLLLRRLTSHAQTTLWLLRQFLPLRFQTTPRGELTCLDIIPR